jgi:hypothetical protein
LYIDSRLVKVGFSLSSPCQSLGLALHTVFLLELLPLHSGQSLYIHLAMNRIALQYILRFNIGQDNLTLLKLLVKSQLLA